MPRPPIKVLFFIDNLDSGGTQRQLTLLLANLDPSQVDPTVCSYQPSRNFFLPQLESAGVRVVSIPKSRRLQPTFILSLARFIRRERFDLVHAFLRSSNVWGCIAGRLARHPRVLVSERRAEFGVDRVDRLVSPVILRLAHQVTTNSRVACERLVRTTGVRPDKVTVIYNGIPDLASPTPPPSTGCVFTMAATFSANKNHRCVVEAFDRAFDDLPQPAILQFAGNEEDGRIRQELETLLSGRPCARQVRFLGRREDIADIFSASHGVVLASFNEAFPNVLLEAMLCERPVLASRVCEHPEIVGGQGERGWLFDPRDSDALAEAMLALGNMPREQRFRLGQRCGEWVRQHFSVRRMVRETVALYQRMLE